MVLEQLDWLYFEDILGYYISFNNLQFIYIFLLLTAAMYLLISFYVMYTWFSHDVTLKR